MSRFVSRVAARLTTRHRVTAGALLATSALAVTAPSPAAAAQTGPYSVKWSEPADLRNHTVFRPATPAGQKLPVLVWGQSGCIANGLIFNEFLTEIASHGILVVASGGPFQIGATTWGYMSRSIDWVKEQNVKAGGQYNGRLIADKIAASGHSCGGLEALTTTTNRPEVAALALMNSGQINVNQAQLDKVKVPTMYVLGGPGDVAYGNGLRDFDRLPKTIPAFLTSNTFGHFGTYYERAGGSHAQVLRDWILWNVTGSQLAAKRFVGADCIVCVERGWVTKKRNIA